MSTGQYTHQQALQHIGDRYRLPGRGGDEARERLFYDRWTAEREPAWRKESGFDTDP